MRATDWTAALVEFAIVVLGILVAQLDNSSRVVIPDLRAETYQELESSGRLSLLRDTEPRRWSRRAKVCRAIRERARS